MWCIYNVLRAVWSCWRVLTGRNALYVRSYEAIGRERRVGNVGEMGQVFERQCILIRNAMHYRLDKTARSSKQGRESYIYE